MKSSYPDVRAHSRSLFVMDGPNFDWAISTLLGRKPTRYERPSFESFAHTICEALEKAVGPKLYVTLQREDVGHSKFVDTLRKKLGWIVKVAPPRLSRDDEDPSDSEVAKALRLAPDRGYHDVVLVTHDHGYIPVVQDLLHRGVAVTICCFLELLHRDYDGLRPVGLEIVDPRRLGLFKFSDPDGGDLADLIPPNAEDDHDHGAVA